MKALFLDRDGVINEDTGYVCSIEEFKLCESNLLRIKQLMSLENFDYIFIVTNQAGIARGLYSEEEFLIFQNVVETKLDGIGIHIDKTYYCPHHPSEGNIEKYAIDCDCRKPKPGMLLLARDEFHLDMAASLLIGDKESDILAGVSAGCRTLNVSELSS